jgi:hypothetical protein
MQVQQYLLNPKVLAKPQPDFEQGSPPNWQETFWGGIGERPKSRTMACCEQEGFHWIEFTREGVLEVK